MIRESSFSFDFVYAYKSAYINGLVTILWDNQQISK